jgi:hypothetical protein
MAKAKKMNQPYDRILTGTVGGTKILKLL